jgi:hypothetical protein
MFIPFSKSEAGEGNRTLAAILTTAGAFYAFVIQRFEGLSSITPEEPEK